MFRLISEDAEVNRAAWVSDERVSLGVQDASGKDVDLSVYKGKVLLIVNVASQW
jgi:glutathione peroxidase